MDSREIDTCSIIGQSQGSFRVSYNSRDILLYALGIGCHGRDDDRPGDAEMRYLYEGHPYFSAFPTYPLVLPFKGASSDVVPFPGTSRSSTSHGSHNFCDHHSSVVGAVKPFFNFQFRRFG